MLNRGGSEPSAGPVEMLEPRRLWSVATVTTIAPSASTVQFGQSFDLVIEVKTSRGKVVNKGTVELFEGNKYTGVKTSVGSKGFARIINGPANTLYISKPTFSVRYIANAGFAASKSKKTTVTIEAPQHLKTESNGLGIEILTAGKGPAVVKGDVVVLQNTGFRNGGTLIDATAGNPGGSETVTVEATPEKLLKGFDEGLIGMRAGEVRDIAVPSALGYNDGTLLLFVVRLVSIKS